MAVRADDVDVERDRDLVHRYQAGDPDAFDDLYRRYFGRLNAYCRRRVGDPDTAEELAQEAFARALRAMPRFAGERRFYPWMTVIAHRLCIDHHRRRARVEPSDVIDLGTVEPDVDHLFDAVDHQLAGEALDRLAPRHREVLRLREADALSYQQIADRLEVPTSTVETLLHRARKALRREFRSLNGHGAVLVPALPLGSLRHARRRLPRRLRWLVPAAGTLAAVAATGAAVAAGLVAEPAVGPAEVPTVSVPERAPVTGLEAPAATPSTVQAPTRSADVDTGAASGAADGIVPAPGSSVAPGAVGSGASTPAEQPPGAESGTPVPETPSLPDDPSSLVPDVDDAPTPEPPEASAPAPPVEPGTATPPPIPAP